MSANQKRPFSIKRLLLKLGFSFGVFLACMGVFEGVLHLMGYGNLEIYEPDPHLYWKLRSNQHCFTKVNHQAVRINALGTRGPEFQVSKPLGTLRILSLGDSRTFGWGLSEEETYSGRLQQMLQEKLGSSKNVEVINAGVNGWSYPQMLVYFRDVALAYHPDFVILGEANSWTQFSEKNSSDFVRKFMLRVRLKNLLRRSAIYHYAIELKLKDFYERHRTKFIPVDPKQDQFFKEQQQKDPDALFRSAIEDLCGLALSNHVQPVLLFLPALEDLTATNSSSIFKIKQVAARKLNVPLADPTADLQGGGKSLYLEDDPIHFNAEGNRIIAEAIFKTATNLSSQ